MTAHDHRTYVDGCYRCELSRDEVEPMSDRTPADVIETALRNEGVSERDVDQMGTIVLDALAAAGFRVVPIPDDNTRAEDAWQALSADLTRVLHASTVVTDRELPDLVADAVKVVHGWLAVLDGQPQDRPAHCPTCGSDNRDVILDGSPCDPKEPWVTTDSWHVGGSGDTL